MAQALLPGPSLDQGLSLIVVCPKIYGPGLNPYPDVVNNHLKSLDGESRIDT
jgi:hypothetical protein